MEELKSMDVFSMLNKEEIGMIAGMSEERSYGAGERIIEDGKSSGTLFVVLEGSVAVRKGDALRLPIGRGGLIGELSFIDDGPPSADVLAEEDVRLLAIPFDALRSLLMRNMNIAYWVHTSLLNILCGKIRETNEWLFRQGIRPETEGKSRVVYL